MLPQYVLLLVLSAASVEFKCGYYLLFQFLLLTSPWFIQLLCSSVWSPSSVSPLTPSQLPSFKNLENVLVPHNVGWATFIPILS